MATTVHKNEFIFAASDADPVMEKVRAQVEIFCSSHGAGARVISFYEPTRLKLPEMAVIKFWRDLISSEHEERYQLDAHSHLQRMLMHPDLPHEDVLLCNWSLLFIYMYQSVVINDLIKKQKSPLCLILSGGGADKDFLHFSAPLGSPVPLHGLQIPLEPVELEAVELEAVESSEAEIKETGTKNLYLLIVEDTGSRLNINPALAICRELLANRRSVHVLTSSMPVKAAMEKAGVPVTIVDFSGLSARKMAELQNRVIDLVEHLDAMPERDRVDELFAATIRAKLLSWMRDVELLGRAVRNLLSTNRCAGLLSVGPSGPLAIIAGQAWRKKSRLWTAYLPALINASIECRFYPADRYLVYGAHASGVIQLSGYPENHITPVGSTGLDQVINEKRSKPEDRKAIDKIAPFAIGKKLVVIGTERRPGELAEIVQILQEIIKIPGVCAIVKVHPDQSPVTFEKEVARIAPDRMKVIHHCDLHALLNGSDLLLCSASNLNLLAAVFKTPALVITLNGEPYRVDFPKEGLCRKVTRRGEISAAINALLFDDETRKQSLLMYDTAIERFNCFNDGKTASRIVSYLIRDKRKTTWNALINEIFINRKKERFNE